MIKEFILPQKGETKFIFFSGKGGVGKSTMSCSTAVWIAKKGYKTLLVTTDPAPNLSDIFGQEIGSKIVPINTIGNLFAIEINPDVASEEYRARAISPMKELLDERSLKTVKEQLSSPCVEEVAAFDKFIEFMDDPQFDVVIFDTAPTGHTLRLLELPSGWSEELEKGGSTCIGPSASLQNEKIKYDKAISYLQDKDKTTFVFVLRPENSSILETKRSSEELSKLGIHLSFLIVNEVLPQEACTDDFFKKKKADEQKIIDMIEKDFKMEKIYFPLMDSEILKANMLDSAAVLLYEEKSTKNASPITIEAPEVTLQLEADKKRIDPLLMPLSGTRYVFFTGKGGVGKSTVACTAAVYLAGKGFKTLIYTTDPASHLQDIFSQEINTEPTEIAGIKNLFAARLDQKKAIIEYKERIMSHLMKQFEHSSGIKINTEATRKKIEEDLNSPCAEEMAAFEKFMSYFEPSNYDVIIFDTAPTGHTLRLLELPSDWKSMIDLGTLTKETSPETRNKYANVIATMQSREKSTFVFVMYPEYTPIIEAWRASEELKKQVGIETALVAVNYVLPINHGNNSFFNKRREQQQKYLEEIKKKFHTPLFLVPLLEREPKGLSDLRELAKIVFGE
jgi:arsenite-transporting ATPase